jgi:hypothetical protein
MTVSAALLAGAIGAGAADVAEATPRGPERDPVAHGGNSGLEQRWLGAARPSATASELFYSHALTHFHSEPFTHSSAAGRR